MHDKEEFFKQARYLVKKKQMTEAIVLLQHGLEQATDNEEQVEIWFELGIIYCMIADFPHALNHFDAVLCVKPDHSQARAYI